MFLRCLRNLPFPLGTVASSTNSNEAHMTTEPQAIHAMNPKPARAARSARFSAPTRLRLRLLCAHFAIRGISPSLWLAVLLKLVLLGGTQAATERQPGEPFSLTTTKETLPAPSAGYVKYSLSWKPEPYRLYSLQTSVDLDPATWVTVATSYATSTASGRRMSADILTVAPQAPASGPAPAAPTPALKQKFVMINLWRGSGYTEQGAALMTACARWKSLDGTRTYTKTVNALPAALKGPLTASLDVVAGAAGQEQTRYSCFLLLDAGYDDLPLNTALGVTFPTTPSGDEDAALWASLAPKLATLAETSTAGAISPPPGGSPRKFWRVVETANLDSDGDGLRDADEVAIGSNPFSADTNGDGVSDGVAVSRGWNPAVADTDHDGLKDVDELTLGTSPLQFDMPKLTLVTGWRDATTSSSPAPGLYHSVSGKSNLNGVLPFHEWSEPVALYGASKYVSASSLSDLHKNDSGFVFPKNAHATLAADPLSPLTAIFRERRSGYSSGGDWLVNSSLGQRQRTIALKADRPMPFTYSLFYRVTEFRRTRTELNQTLVWQKIDRQTAKPLTIKAGKTTSNDPNPDSIDGTNSDEQEVTLGGGAYGPNFTQSGIDSPSANYTTAAQDSVLSFELMPAPLSTSQGTLGYPDYDGDKDRVPDRIEPYAGGNSSNPRSRISTMLDSDSLAPEGFFPDSTMDLSTRSTSYLYNSSGLVWNTPNWLYGTVISASRDLTPASAAETLTARLGLGDALHLKFATMVPFVDNFASEAANPFDDSIINADPQAADASILANLYGVADHRPVAVMGYYSSADGLYNNQSAGGRQRHVRFTLDPGPKTEAHRYMLRVKTTTRIVMADPPPPSISADLVDFTIPATTGSTKSSSPPYDLLAKLPFAPPTGENAYYTVVEKLLPCDMAADTNRDGSVELGESGTQQAPLRFWINNDFDRLNNDSESEGTAADNSNAVIENARELEDFNLLKIKLDYELLTLMATGEVKVGFKWTNTTGTPGVNLFKAARQIVDAKDYLNSLETAELQLSGDTAGAKASVTPGSTAWLANDAFKLLGTPPGTQQAIMLFEGTSTGKGKLCLVIKYKTALEVVGPGVWLDLVDVHAMIENAMSTPESFPNPPNFDTTEPPQPSVGFSRFNWSGHGAFQPAQDETNEAIVLVHGWNMTDQDRRTFAASFYKRLWWKGYKGRFCTFAWPTYNEKDDFLWKIPDHYNPSEYVGWKCGPAFAAYCATIGKASLNVAAHSMGNIVMASALKSGLTVSSYVAMQAAIPAGCYDASAAANSYRKFTLREESDPTPDLASPDRGYRGLMSGYSGRFFNFFNAGDYALATGMVGPIEGNWEANQLSWKPNTWPLRKYRYLPDNPLSQRCEWGIALSPSNQPGWTHYRWVTDPHETMSFIARPRSKALGTLTTNGFQGVDLLGEIPKYPFGRDRSEHSGQFQRPVQKTSVFYDNLLESLNVGYNKPF